MEAPEFLMLIFIDCLSEAIVEVLEVFWRFSEVFFSVRKGFYRELKGFMLREMCKSRREEEEKLFYSEK